MLRILGNSMWQLTESKDFFILLKICDEILEFMHFNQSSNKYFSFRDMILNPQIHEQSFPSRNCGIEGRVFKCFQFWEYHIATINVLRGVFWQPPAISRRKTGLIQSHSHRVKKATYCVIRLLSSSSKSSPLSQQQTGKYEYFGCYFAQIL